MKEEAQKDEGEMDWAPTGAKWAFGVEASLISMDENAENGRAEEQAGIEDVNTEATKAPTEREEQFHFEKRIQEPKEVEGGAFVACVSGIRLARFDASENAAPLDGADAERGGAGKKEEEKKMCGDMFGIFVPPFLVDPILRHNKSSNPPTTGLTTLSSGESAKDQQQPDSSSVALPQHLLSINSLNSEAIASVDLASANTLLKSIHPSLIDHVTLFAVLAVRRPSRTWLYPSKSSLPTPQAPTNTPADLLLFTSAQTSTSLDQINGQPMAAASYSLINLLPLSRLCIHPVSNHRQQKQHPIVHMGHCVTTDTTTTPFISNGDLPTCPVCLNRIEPTTLGLRGPNQRILCSQLCVATSSRAQCHNAKLLDPWPDPTSPCATCSLIHGRTMSAAVDTASEDHESPFSARWRRGPSSTLGGFMTMSAWSVHATANRPPATNNSRHELTPSALSPSTTPHPGPPSSDIPNNDKPLTTMRCYKCGMRETLWVCLTCGVVGCCRYSQKHAYEHRDESGHPYSLELATQRIWDYDTSEFVHRQDILSCPSIRHPTSTSQYLPSSTPTTGTMFASASNNSASTSNHAPSSTSTDTDDTACGNSNGRGSMSGFHGAMSLSPFSSSTTTAPKKATMIGEEYEALLQSALEDQAQHYEGLMSRMRAEWAARNLSETTTTTTTTKKDDIETTTQINALQNQIQKLRSDTDRLSRELLNAQAEEAGQRAISQRLLREQSVSKSLLDRMKAETTEEHARGKKQVEELEEQVSDLTANLRMLNQFREDRELNNAQIFGTMGGKTGRSGKKQRRQARR